MMNRIIFILALGIFSTTKVSGQTDNDLMKMGDAAMANGQYSNAVHFYSFILFKIQQGEEAIYYPYEITTAYKEPEKNEDGTVSPPENPTPKQIVLIHKLSDAYRLADDYKNAEIWYSAALKNPKEEFPYAQYFYAVSLMYNSKFEEAMAQFEQFQQSNNNPDNQYYQLATSKIASCQFAMNPLNTKGRCSNQ
jgi:tetratricopeptide (TPR) repeat protein